MTLPRPGLGGLGWFWAAIGTALGAGAVAIQVMGPPAPTQTTPPVAAPVLAAATSAAPSGPPSPPAPSHPPAGRPPAGAPTSLALRAARPLHSEPSRPRRVDLASARRTEPHRAAPRSSDWAYAPTQYAESQYAESQYAPAWPYAPQAAYQYPRSSYYGYYRGY